MVKFRIWLEKPATDSVTPFILFLEVKKESNSDMVIACQFILFDSIYILLKV